MQNPRAMNPQKVTGYRLLSNPNHPEWVAIELMTERRARTFAMPREMLEAFVAHAQQRLAKMGPAPTRQ